MENLVGRKLGKYEIREVIGRGGMATVFKGFDTVLDRACAIKVLPPQFSHDPAFLERFRREARTVARLNHPNILQIYDAGEHDGTSFLVMPLVPGGSLDLRLAAGPLSLSEVAGLLTPVAAALDYAHSRGVLHRDVKPSNIMFDEQERPLLLDFGLAKMLTGTSMALTGSVIIGTPHYMAPEMINSSGMVDARTDIYALGVVAFELLTGQVPFTGQSPVQVMMAIASEDAPTILSVRPELPPGLNAVFRQALARNPEDRFQTAAAFVVALTEVTNESGEMASVRPVGEPTPLPLPTSRNWANATIGGPAGPVAATGMYAQPLAPDRTMIGPSDLRPPPDGKPRPLARLAEMLAGLFGGREEAQTDEPMSWAGPVVGQSDPEDPLRPPTVPPTVMEAARPTLILQDNVHNFLAPAARHGIFELLSQQEPDRIVSYLTTYDRGRFLITGYGSFGGTSLTREIGRLVRRELLSPWVERSEYVMVVRLGHGHDPSSPFCEYATELQRSNGQDDPLGKFWLQVPDGNSGNGPLETGTLPGAPVSMLFDELLAVLEGQRSRSALRGTINKALHNRPQPARLIVIVDRVTRPEEALALLEHPIWQWPKTSLLAVVEREQFNRWPRDGWSRLQAEGRFQPWSVPCLWEDDRKLVEQTMNLLFRGFQLDSDEARNKYRLFRKHLAYIGRGLVGATIYELRQYRYWRIDNATNQPYIPFDALDDDLIRHHAWIYDLLEMNWDRILGTSFPGQDRTDRAKQGVYSFMDWVIDSATFTLEEALEEVDQRPVWISPHKRLRSEVALRVLEVLMENSYVDQYQNAFDVVWGREISPQREAARTMTIHGKEIELWQQRKEVLLEDIEAAMDQQGRALDDVVKRHLQRQIDKYEAELAEINRKLATLQAEEQRLSMGQTMARAAVPAEENPKIKRLG